MNENKNFIDNILNHAYVLSNKTFTIDTDYQYNDIFKLFALNRNIDPIELLDNQRSYLGIDEDDEDTVNNIKNNLNLYDEYLNEYDKKFEEFKYHMIPYLGKYEDIENKNTAEFVNWVRTSNLLSNSYDNNYFFSSAQDLDKYYEFEFALDNKTIIDIFNEIDTDSEVNLVYFKPEDSDVIFKINKYYQVPNDIKLMYATNVLYVNTESYGLIEINFNNNNNNAYFELKIKNNINIENLTRQFEKIFKSYFYDAKIISTESEYYLFGLNYEIVSLLDYIQTTIWLRDLAVIYEQMKPVDYQNIDILRLHINSGTDNSLEVAIVDLQLGTLIGEYRTTIPILDSNDILFRSSDYDIDNDVIRIKIRTMNTNKYEDEDIKDYVRFFIARLLDQYQDYKHEIIDIYKDIDPNLKEKSTFTIGIPILDYDNVQLKNIIPNLFVSNYARNGCVKRRQPRISLDDPGNQYADNQKIEFDIYDDNKEIINRVFFYCDKENHPYIGLKENKLLNKDLYEVIPCCYKNPGTGILKIPKERNRILKTFQDLQPNRVGLFNTKIGEYLYLKWNKISDKHMYILREGLEKSNNNVLDGICKSLNIKKDFDKIRKELSNMNMEIISSENYDRSYDSLREEILQNNALELNRFYRLLEVYFDINILVFNSTSIEIPLHRSQFQTSYDENKYTVIFYKLNNIYELLIWSNINHGNINEKNINRIIKSTKYQLFMKNIEDELFKTHVLDLRNLNKIYYESNLKIPLDVVSQLIDINGKARMFNIDIGNNSIRSIITPMKRPLNVKLDINIYMWNIDEVIDYFGENMKIISLAPDGMYIRSHELIFIPIYNFDFDEFPHIPRVQIPVLSSIEMNIYLNEEAYKEKIIRIILEVSLWYYLYLKYSDINLFLEEQIIIDESVSYNLNILNSILPKNNDEFSNIINTGLLNNENKIVLNSTDLYVILEQFLENWVERKYNTKDIEKLTSLYVNISDYKSKDYELVLLGEDSFNKWINNKNDILNLEIHTKISISHMFKKLPFIYQDEEYGDFIIQNLKIPNFNNAIYVSRIWKEQNRNLSYDNKYYITDHTINYQLYGISKDYKIRLIKASNSDHVKILNYFGNFYASILPI